MEIERLRSKIRQNDIEVAKLESAIDSLDSRVSEEVAELRAVLECEPGEEKRALGDLRETVETEIEMLEGIFGQIESMKGEE